MNRVVGVGAHRAIPDQQLLDLLGQHPMQAIGRVRGHRRRAEHPGQFGAVAGRPGAGVEQPVAQPVQQLEIPAVQFQFPFPPVLFGLVVLGAFGRRGDLVVAELGQHLTPIVAQHHHAAGGMDSCNGCQRPIPYDRRHHVEQFVRNLRAQGCAHLCAGLRPGRKFQVPAGVGTAGAPAQRDPPGRQVVPGCIEVHSRKSLCRQLLNSGDPGDAVEGRRDRRRVNAELAFHLAIPRGVRIGCRHGVQPVTSRPPGHCVLTKQSFYKQWF